MKATHIFAGLYPVVVRPDPGGYPELAQITYVGPEVPGNRRIGETRIASRKSFTGEPTLIPINPIM